MGPAIAVRGLAKQHAGRLALDGIDLDVGEGSVHGLLGPNGAGKTTLLRVLFGLVRPDRGGVELFGRPLDDPRRLDGVAGFTEAPRFYPYLSGRANLEVLAALDGDASAPAVDEVLGQVDLTDRSCDLVGGYSLGMRQRLGIAAALLRRPRLLVLDEVANGLDPAGGRDVRRLIEELAGRGLTVLVSSHEMSEVEQLCDAVTILHRGQVVHHGAVDELRRHADQGSFRLRTTDDATALVLAGSSGDVSVVPADDDGLLVEASQPALDAFVLTLGRAGIAVQRLALAVAPLEQLFFRLTEQPTAGTGRD